MTVFNVHCNDKITLNKEYKTCNNVSVCTNYLVKTTRKFSLRDSRDILVTIAGPPCLITYQNFVFNSVYTISSINKYLQCPSLIDFPMWTYIEAYNVFNITLNNYPNGHQCVVVNILPTCRSQRFINCNSLLCFSSFIINPIHRYDQIIWVFRSTACNKKWCSTIGTKPTIYLLHTKAMN